MSTKLRIRIGEVEVEYEGEEQFLKEELPELLKTAMELRRASAPDDRNKPNSTSSSSSSTDKGKPAVAGTTTAVAAKLKVSSGPGLLLAAAARLTLAANKSTFTRSELLNEMQSAVAYYKQNYSKNLSSMITRRIAENELTETAKDTYALTAGTRQSLELQLADA